MNKKYIEFSSFFPKSIRGGVYAGISLASAGTMHPFDPEGLQNRHGLFSELPFESPDISFCRQTHSHIVHDADDRILRGEEGDGMITAVPGRFLSVTVADCMPVVLYDKQNQVLGLCHSGWKGTGIALKALKLMKTLHGTRGRDVLAFLGPAIGSCCYQVDSRRAQIFQKTWGRGTVREERGNFFLDLPAANILALESAGLKDIVNYNQCTQCDPRYGSFRREGPEQFIRMVAWAGFH